MDWLETSRDYRSYLYSISKSENTTKTYVSNLSIFWRWCMAHECHPEVVDREAIRAWVSDRRKEAGGGRISNDLAALKLYYEWLRDLRRRDDNPADGITVKRPKVLPTKPLSTEELNAMVAACKIERDRMIILVLANTGLRISEVAALTASDIDWRNGVILIHGKGEKEREVRPHGDVMGRLRAYMGMFPDGPLWLSQRRHEPMSAHQIRKILDRVADMAGVEDFHPHRLRAYFATEFIEQFKDIQALQGMLGHTSIETTQRYSEYTKRRRALEMMSQFQRGIA